MNKQKVTPLKAILIFGLATGYFFLLLFTLLWMIFHIPFGMDLMIMLIPVIIIIPYAFHKTQNTLVGIFIHEIYNGPLFVAVALGLIKY